MKKQGAPWYYSGGPVDSIHIFSTPKGFVGNFTTSTSTGAGGSGLWIETHAQHDQCGSPRKIWDAKGNLSQIEYAGSFQYAYPTHTISPAPTGGSALETYTGYDPATGVLTSSTDANGQVTNFYYVDSLNRLTRVETPSGGWTNYSYGDAAGNLYVRTQSSLDATRSLDAYQYFDGLGRAVRSFAAEHAGNDSGIITDTQYDNMGRVQRVSNPFRWYTLGAPVNPSGEWTTMSYDALGRVRTVTTPDNAVVNTDYSLNQVTVTDQASKARRSVTDALGRLVQVIEDPAGLAYQTDYGYDTLGNLTSVTQGTQPARTFEYDTLSRLKSAANPESGRVDYTYDENSNVLTKTDARGVIATYEYDELNRVKSRTYTLPQGVGATATVSYAYDAGGVPFSKGRLTSVSSSVSSYAFGSYDAMGRVLTATQTTDGQPYPMSYSYDLAGNMISETYPSNKTIVTEYEGAGRIAGVKKQGAPWYYAGGPVDSIHIFYAANGAAQDMPIGNGRVEHTAFNNRLQPTQITLDSNTPGSNTMKLDYGYGAATANNGNVISQTITVPKSAGGNLVLTQNYTYDALNRLSTAEELIGTASQWKQTYDIDRWGNRAVRSTSTYIPTPALTPQSANSTDFSAFNQGNNRIARTGFGYDVAGNLTGDPTTNANAMLYDGENRQTSYTKAGATTSYSYDGDGRRVKKIVGNDTTVFVYNVAGQLIAEYTSGAPAAGDTSYLTTDHLGSTRLVTDSGGNVKARYDYLPFGEEIGSSVGSRSTVVGYGGTDSTKQKFTQKERDSESGLDYFLARYYSSAQGRFTSIDPYNINLETQMATDSEGARSKVIAYLSSPQQWNRYPYVTNNPLKYVDPYGELLEIFGTEEERKKALGRIQGVVGEKAAGLLYVREDNGHYYVDYKGKDRDALAATSELGVHIADIIDSDKTVEFHIATTFSAKSSEWFGLSNKVRTHLVTTFGGAATVGAEESLTGNAQIFVHPEAGNVTQEVFGRTFLSRTRSSDGRPLDFYNDIVDAHEFGHAYANVVKGVPLSGSRASESYPYALRMENYVRARRHMPNRRISE